MSRAFGETHPDASAGRRADGRAWKENGRASDFPLSPPRRPRNNRVSEISANSRPVKSSNAPPTVHYIITITIVMRRSSEFDFSDVVRWKCSRPLTVWSAVQLTAVQRVRRALEILAFVEWSWIIIILCTIRWSLFFRGLNANWFLAFLRIFLFPRLLNSTSSFLSVFPFVCYKTSAFVSKTVKI